MKYIGDNFLLEKERNEELYKIYQQLYFEKGLTVDEIAEAITAMPSRRFWISERSAAVVISRMMKGQKVTQKQMMKREMYREIFRRVMALKRKRPSMSIKNMVAAVVAQPAPKFYLGKHAIKRTLYRIINGWYRRREIAQKH